MRKVLNEITGSFYEWPKLEVVELGLDDLALNIFFDFG